MVVASTPYYALEQARDASHGGEGWEDRAPSSVDEIGSVWAEFGVGSECGTLRAVLMHRPGPEIDGITDAARALWYEIVDPVRAREQHDALTELYRAHGVAVHELGGPTRMVAPKGPLGEFLTWDSDGQRVFMNTLGVLPQTITAFDTRTGEVSLVRQGNLADSTGAWRIRPVFITPDGRTMAYSVARQLDELYVYRGVR